MSQPSSSFICVPLVVGYVYFGIKILVENARKGTHWAWCDDHLADYVGSAHCRAERLPDHSTRERCNFLYGVALLLMAACMVFAGANYQAFTWQLHCEGADAACIKNPARDLEPAAVDQLREADADLADREDQLRKTRARIQSERSAQETILRSFREPS